MTPQEHARLIQSLGGVFNGTTHRDHTSYFEVLPAEALELGLFLEADRMLAPGITAETIAGQAAVISQEIHRTVLNRPFGGFPTFLLPPVLFDGFANSHDGYGDHRALADVRVDECRSFFDSYYAPGNAVLAVCGPVAPEAVAELAERHFGGIPPRPVPPPPELSEPMPSTRRVAERSDPLAPVPALTLGWRMPPPDTPEYLAAVVTASVLGGGESGRLRRAIARQSAVQVMAMPGLTGPFEARDPDVFLVNAICAPGSSLPHVAEAVTDQLALLARTGPAEAELRRAARRLATAWYRATDSVGTRSARLAGYDLLYGDAELVQSGPARLAAVGPDDVRAAATALAGQHHAELHLKPARDHR